MFRAWGGWWRLVPNQEDVVADECPHPLFVTSLSLQTPKSLLLPLLLVLSLWAHELMGRAHIDDHCKKSHCAKAMKELEACTERVNAKYANAKPGKHHCVGRVGVGREG